MSDDPARLDEGSAAPRSEGRSGSPASSRLTRELIVATAISFVDTYGLQAMSMRQLGKVLGVEGMAIYHHVNGREDLLEAMVARLVDAVRVPPHDAVGDADGWQGFIVVVAHRVRALAAAHPNFFPLIATRPPAAPWLRPPLRSLDLVEDFLSGLLARGLSEESAVYVYKAFSGFLLGHLLLEVAQRGADTGPVDEPFNEGEAEVTTRDEAVALDDFPTVRRLKRRLSTHDADSEFESGLESLLDRLDYVLSQ